MTHSAERADFDGVVQRYGDALSRFAWGYVADAADHADLMQEILVALWQALPRFRSESSVWTFVFRVAHNRALSFAGRSRRRASLPLTDQLRDPRPAPDAEAHARVERDRLLRAIRSLPEPLRQAVLLHLEGATPAEIAAVQGITDNNASVRLTRARQALRDLLDPETR